MKLQVNLRDRDPAEFSPLLDRAKAVGVDTVLFIDGKTNNYTKYEWAALYVTHLRALREAISARGMKLILMTSSIGYCDSILANDPNLANAYPLHDVVMTARAGLLVATESAALVNGSFEQSKQGKLAGWDLKDAGATIDTTVAHSGAASVRLTTGGDPKASARVFGVLAVKPFHQYRIRFWARMSELDANSARLFVLDPDGRRERDLTSQYLSLPNQEIRSYFSFYRGRSFDWAEMQIAFNSLELKQVRIGFGIDGSRGGTMWVDDVRVQSTPSLNLLRRDALPFTFRGTDGTTYEEGRDVVVVSDPMIGKSGFDGLFDTYHTPPEIVLAKGTRIPEGARVKLDGWHAMVTASGQTGCSWHDPSAVALLDRIQRRLQADAAPDGYMLDLDEIRTGGWEPTDRSFGSSGAALAALVRREVTRTQEIVPGQPAYVWNDMLDPFANARPGDYYQVNGPLKGSWKGLPKDVVIVNWTAGGSAVGSGSMMHFAKLGNRQLLAGFYDHDVAENRAGWARVARGVPNVIGSMYTTWQNDYTQLEAFSRAWWG